MVKEERILVEPKEVLSLLVGCANCNREVRIPLDAEFDTEIKCPYCRAMALSDVGVDFRHFHRLVKTHITRFRLEILEPVYDLRDMLS